MRTVRTAVCLFAILVPSTLRAQVTVAIPSDTKLAEVLATVYATEIIDNILAGADPVSAFSDYDEALIITQAISSQLATFPLGSSAGGFSWTFMPGTGTFSRTTESFGPIFAERALTIGRRRLNVGLNYQRTAFNSFEGRDLRDREIVFYTPFPGGVIGEDALDLDLTTQTFGFFANYGVTDRLDVGVAVPIVHTELQANLRFHFVTINGSRLGTFEQFTTGGGSATGISDIVVRTKYRVLDLKGGGVAAGLDLRLPSGDEENLLGIPGTQAKVYGVFSMTHKRISPHANVGYTFSKGNDLVDDPNNFVYLEPPDELDYTFGTEVAATPRFTVAVDIVGRSIKDVPRLEFGDVGLGTALSEFSFAGNSTLNQLLAAVGVKFNVYKNLLVSASLLFPFTDGGLRAKPTPVIGVDYSF